MGAIKTTAGLTRSSNSTGLVRYACRLDVQIARDKVHHGLVLVNVKLTMRVSDERILGLTLMLFNFLFMMPFIHHGDNDA
jgi:hypothetical protein